MRGIWSGPGILNVYRVFLDVYSCPEFRITNYVLLNS